MNGNTHGIDETFIRNRIRELREQKGVNEYNMSLDLSKSKGYIQNIMACRALPTIAEFLRICNYLGVTPKQFFDKEDNYPVLINQAIGIIRSFDKEGVKTALGILELLKNRYIE
jgi:transcriptional regulator with XRE-family HTH domain